MSSDEFRQKRDEVYNSKLQPSLKGQASWYARNSKELRDAWMHPDMATEIGQLMLCDSDSLAQNRGRLISVFVQTYDLSVEIAEKTADFIITNDKINLSPIMMSAGIHFFSNEKKIAGVTQGSEKLYKSIQSEYGKERPSTIYLRIGPSATKDDIHDWIDTFWDKYVEPLRDAQLHKGRQVREKPKVARDTMIYALWKEGKKYAEISKYIDEHYNEFLIDTDLRKIVERTKPKTNILADFSRQFNELYPKSVKAKKNIAMKKIDESTPDNTLFQLEIV